MVRCLLYTMLGLFLFTGLASVQAQSIHDHAMCGVSSTESEAIKQRMLSNRRNRAELLAKFENGRSGNNKVYVPVQFFIVTKSDKTGGETQKDILDNLCKLNQDYDSIGVEFYLAGPILWINQDLLYDNNRDNTMADYFMNLYRVPGVVNVFVGNSIGNLVSGGVTLGYYTSGLDIIYVIRAAINGNNTTLTHEMGHFLGLPHTFNGWENLAYSAVADGNPATLGIIDNTTGRTPTILPNGAPVESIPRTGGRENCQVAGDGFCDTDPNYLFGFYRNRYNDGNCTYAATAMDPNGWLFLPSVIAPQPTRFYFDEDTDEIDDFWLKNNSTKDRIFRKTLIVLEAEYTLNGTTTMMWTDTLGNSDTTEVSADRNAEKDIIGLSVGQTDPGHITMGGHYFDISVSSPTAPSLVFDAAPAEYSILNIQSIHRVDMDSLRVTNPATSGVTVPVGTGVVVTDIFSNAGGQISSADRSPYLLPIALAPGESYTFLASDLRVDNPAAQGIAGVVVNFKTYAPYRATTGTTSDNVMSYYDDACVIGFSNQQADAMKQDIASRGFATLYPTPAQVDINTQATVQHPLNNSVLSDPLVHFAWDAVPGAAFYEVVIYQVSPVTGGPIAGGDRYEHMVTGTELWLSIAPGRFYKWTVLPVNSTRFCDRTLQSSDAQFEVYGTISVNQVDAPNIRTNIYPNPAEKQTMVTVDIQANNATQARIAVYNSVGQRLMPTQVVELLAGSNLHQLNTVDLPAGLYIINIETEEGTQSHKLTIGE